MPRHASLFALLALGACAGPGEPPPTTASTPPPSTTAVATVPPPTPVAPSVRVTAPACGYGGSAPAVAVFVDLDTDTTLTGVTVSFTLQDIPTGAPRGRSTAPETLVVSPVERGLLDFSTQGTTPFGGVVPAGSTTRLEYYAGLGEDPSGAIPAAALGHPIRVDVLVHANEGDFTASCDTSEMWPSS